MKTLWAVSQKAVDVNMVGQTKYLLLIILPAILLSALSEETNEDRFSLNDFLRVPCRSGTSEKRFCVPLRQCPVLLAQVRNRNPGRIFQYLNEYTFPCLVPGQVCCPETKPWNSFNGNQETPWTWPKVEATSGLPSSRPSLQTSSPSSTTEEAKPKFTTTRKTPKKTTSTTPKPVQDGSTKTRHKNRHLLPEDICGVDLGKRVLGGVETGLEEHPWMAVIHLRLPDGRQAFICGGSIISSRYILTAAHCLHPNSLPRNGVVDIVRIGEHNLKSSKDCNADGVCNSPPQDIEIESTIIHTGYTPSEPGTYNDIALIRLKRDIKFSLRVQPICLPLDGMSGKQYEGKKLTTVGWGRTVNGAPYNSPTKQKVQVPVVPMAICAPQYRARKIRLRDTQICAGGEDGKDSCQGDSGGPLMSTEQIGNELKWYIQGIVSTGPKDCGKVDSPALYTRVGKYIKWILDNMYDE